MSWLPGQLYVLRTAFCYCNNFTGNLNIVTFAGKFDVLSVVSFLSRKFARSLLVRSMGTVEALCREYFVRFCFLSKERRREIEI